MKKKIILIFLIFSIFITKVNAKTLNDYYSELNSLQKSYNEAKSKANLTQSQLNALKSQIATAETQIQNTQNEIVKAGEDIAASEKSIEEKKEQTNQMLLYLQLNGDDTSYIDYLFEAEDYTDYIYRYSVVTQLSDYNNELMDELEKLIVTLQEKKTELAKKQTELESQKKDLQSKYATVQLQYKDAQDDGMTVAEQISNLKKVISSYEKVCGSNKNIDVNKCGGVAAVSGWTYPLSSFYQTSNYAWDENRYHYAVDLYTPEGSTVRAVANGRVISYIESTCGGIVIQIEHVYNGTHIISLYMHLLAAYVSTGDVVSGGQKIGLSGGGPREQAQWHDTCTGGAHLHFTMAYGTASSPIGKSSTKGSTFDPVAFFPAMKGIGSSYNGG